MSSTSLEKEQFGKILEAIDKVHWELITFGVKTENISGALASLRLQALKKLQNGK